MPHDGPDHSSGAAANPPGRSLRSLLEHVEAADIPLPPDLPITSIRADSTLVREGDLFVALRGTRTDGHDYLVDAVSRGAAALVVENEPGEALPVPVVRVPDTRRALAELAAAWYDHPARDMMAVGITGTVGKTSVLAMIERIMACQGVGIGTIGSLGVHLQGRTLSETGFTAPDPLLLHEKLAELRDASCRLLALEVTSHALVQQRLHGLRLTLGVFTNLLPLEHQDYHGSFQEYVAAKLRFFELLSTGAPLVYNADDRVVDSIVQKQDVLPVGTGTRAGALIRIADARTSAEGTRLRLCLQRDLRTLHGDVLEPFDIQLELKLLGRSNIYNCALAAATALMLGAAPAAVRDALESLPAPPRRVQMIHDGTFRVIDDTVGHPDSVSAVFEAVGAFHPHRIHVAFAIRGNRGTRINQNTADALAIWAQQMPIATLALTRSEDTTDERNRVSPEERDAFAGQLDDAGVSYDEYARLGDAVQSVLACAGEGDLVLLLGAQGMDAAGEIAKEWLAKNRR